MIERGDKNVIDKAKNGFMLENPECVFTVVYTDSIPNPLSVGKVLWPSVCI